MKTTKFIGYFYYLDHNDKKVEYTDEVNIVGGATNAMVLLMANRINKGIAGELYKISDGQRYWNVKSYVELTNMLE